MNKKTGILIWSIAIIAVLAAAYTFYSKNKPGSSTQLPAQSQTSDSSAGKRKIMAPDFTLKDLDGKDVKLSDYKGKIVILNFWATWCKFCIQEMPDLNQLNKELGKENEAVILTVNAMEPLDTITGYLSKNNISLKVLMDQDSSVCQAYGISGLPTTFIINKDGSLYTHLPGATDRKTLLEILNDVKKSESIK